LCSAPFIRARGFLEGSSNHLQWRGRLFLRRNGLGSPVNWDCIMPFPLMVRLHPPIGRVIMDKNRRIPTGYSAAVRESCQIYQRERAQGSHTHIPSVEHLWAPMQTLTGLIKENVSRC
jgi:hypothetical protein